MNYDKILQLSNRFAILTKNANLQAAQNRFSQLVSNQANVVFGELNIPQKVLNAINSYNSVIANAGGNDFLTENDVPVWNFISAKAVRGSKGWSVSVRIDPVIQSKSKEINNIIKRYENLISRYVAQHLNADDTVVDGKSVKYFSTLPNGTTLGPIKERVSGMKVP